ncbi:Arc family DNA-binding protein [Sinorhizobium fredii]|uniref:Arc family DNA-binding protein n=1 Tax=Rhizobium fredii TaxID=380 RepID=UPI0009B69961|nr:Arc family DNA-binding protein [Sinorhizobium fredii]
MSDDQEEVRLTLRLPAGLRDRLTWEASTSGRSLNGEMVYRLEKSLVDADQAEPAERVAELWQRIEKLEGDVEFFQNHFEMDLRRLEARFVDQQVELRILRDKD